MQERKLGHVARLPTCPTDSVGSLPSRREPVFEPQARNVSKIGRIVRHQREIVDQGHRGDHRIHNANGNPSSQKSPALDAEPFGTGLVIWQDPHIAEQVAFE
jgi:hypothetical protein